MSEREERARRAKAMLDNGIEARDAAAAAGYKSVSGMMGAIALLKKRTEESKAPEQEPTKEAAREPERTERGDLGYSAPCIREAVKVSADELKRRVGDDKDYVVECGDIRLTYRPKTNSIRLNKCGQSIFIWLNDPSKCPKKALRTLRNASIAMLSMLDEDAD